MPFLKGFVISEHILVLRRNPKLKTFVYGENNHVESIAQTTNLKLALKMAYLLKRTLILPLFDCTNGPTYNNPFHKSSIGKTCTAERFVDVKTLFGTFDVTDNSYLDAHLSVEKKKGRMRYNNVKNMDHIALMIRSILWRIRILRLRMNS
jgi:hypothetical protein